MAKKRLSESEIKAILQEVANGAKPTDLAKKHGFSLGSFYNWKNKYEGGAKKSTGKRGRPAKKAAAKPAAKPAAKKRGRPAKKAAAKPAAKPAAKRGRPAKKAAAKPAAKPAAKRGRPAKKTTARRGRPAKAAAAPATSNKKADTLFKKIQSLEAQIEKAKIAYANAILGK